jgi:putative heme-binding domain-containing protein
MRAAAVFAAAILGLLAPAPRVRGQGVAPPPSISLDQELTGEGPTRLAREALRTGDAERGALLFFQPHLACAKCHTSGQAGTTLGPDLPRESRGRSPVELVESVLEPSKVIAKGFEPVTVATTDGKTLTGLLAEDRADALVLKDPAHDGQRVTIPKDSIEERRVGGPSVMPAGLANLLATRQEFLDLVRYLVEVTTHGPSRAIELKPSAWAVAPPPLPPYERELDHAGLIAGLGAESYRRGEATYQRICINCHGTKDRPGSMPTSLRFASGTFKNGSDPFSLYQTLTRGFGQMPAQTTLVPAQKYDVIHFIRETFLKPDNPGQYVAATPAYLARLPKGSARGPKPVASEPWRLTDYGPFLMLTVEVGAGSGNIACKGIAVRLDPGPGGIARGDRWVVYDHDTMRLAGAWTGRGFIDWNGINFNGRHEVHPATVGQIHVTNPDAPGWANPETGRFDDLRIKGRDGHPYGPLPKSWLRYRGLYRSGERVVLAYSVGDAEVLESPYATEFDGRVQFSRVLDIGRSTRDLAVRVVPVGTPATVIGAGSLRLVDEQGSRVLKIPASATPVCVTLLFSDGDRALVNATIDLSGLSGLKPLTRGGPSTWRETLTTHAEIGLDTGPFASDVLTPPEANPWACQFRLSGLDFFEGGQRAAVCSWDGDVWLVDGVERADGRLTWRRIAAGLFQPLGLKIVGGQIYVTCRDQIATLRDLNGDGETDFIECFNSDHQVTEHFHEFAMDLQTDAAGNFYYAKGARHGKTALVPQHGTLLKVRKDGATTEILANGFRAPNGVCLNADGSFFLSDQEGHWTPKNRINRVVRGGFYGNMWGYHDVTDPSDAAMRQPLCWITNAFDRSPAELLWVTSEHWGPLRGSLLSLSYGYGKVFVVPHETLEGQVQGGMCELPIRPYPSGVVRGRFNPADGQLYLCGLFGWASNQEYPGGFYRLRATGKPMFLPVGLKARKAGLAITFTDPLDRKTATDPTHYAARTWGLQRSANYGSPHVNEAPIPVTSATLSDDGRTVTLAIPDLQPTWCMQVAYAIKGARGEPVEGRIHNTIHHLAP